MSERTARQREHDTPVDGVADGNHVVCLSTAPDRDRAAAIARTLVEERLAACVNLVPVAASIYRWEGKLCEEAEVLSIIKTRRDRVDAMRARLVELHPYDCPEVIVLGVEGGHVPYLAWIDAQVA